MESSTTVSIETAAQLFAALRSPDPGTRAGVLHAITANPERALRYGPDNGVALQDKLISMVDLDLDYPYWQDIAAALSRFTGPAVTAFFLRMLQTSTGPESSFPAAERLGLDDHEALLHSLRLVLLDDTHLHRVSAVASVLRDEPGLDARMRVRLAAADARAPAAPVTTETLTWWLDELDGPYREPARTRVESQGAAAARLLGANWRVIPREQQPWAFSWIAVESPHTAMALLGEILRPTPPAEVDIDSAAVAPALIFIAGLHRDDPERDLARGWLDNTDPHVRAAAAAASAQPPSPGTVLDLARAAIADPDGEASSESPSTDLIAVLIDQLRHDPTAQRALHVLRNDERWEIRAAARDALAGSDH